MKAGAAFLARAKKQVSEARLAATGKTSANNSSEDGKKSESIAAEIEASPSEVSFTTGNRSDSFGEEVLDELEALALEHEEQGSSVDEDDDLEADASSTALKDLGVVSIPDELKDFVFHPEPLRLEAWSEPRAIDFKVRSSSYLSDKVKTPSEDSVFRLLAVDLVKVKQLDFKGFCSMPNERMQKALAREKETGVKVLPEFIFAVNLAVPGKELYHCVFYFGIDDISVLMSQDTAFGRLASQFFFGPSDEFRSRTFKLIPRIVKGNVVVRKAVGSKPSILGKKLKQYFVKSDRFFEIIIDIQSNKMAQRIVKLALGYARTLVVDMMFVLEGAGPAVLPERILGGVRLSHIEFKKKDGNRTPAKA